MRPEPRTLSNFDFQRIVLKPVIPVLAVLLLISAVLTMYLSRREDGSRDMTDLLTVEIHRSASGEVEQCDGNAFSVVNKGDRLIVRVPLAQERRVDNAVLCFNIPHVAGYAHCGGEILWAYGEDLWQQGKYVGNLFFRVPVDDAMWGGTLELVLTVTEESAFSAISNVRAIPAVNSIRYYYSQFQLDLLIFMWVLVLSVVSSIVFLFYRGGGVLRLEGLFLAGFCGFLSAWFLAGHGFLYMFSDIVPLCAHAEYIVFHLMPIPFCLFMCVQVKKDRICRLIEEILSVIFVVLFIAATILNYTTRDYHFTTFLPILQVFMVIGVVVSAFMLVRRQYAEDLSSMVIRHGVAISMAMLVLEVARYNVSKYILVDIGLEALSFTSWGMLTFAGTLSLGYIARLTDAVGEESDKALLRRLAYVDVLTGISNRAYCNRKIEEMEHEGEKYFALLFFDLNGLKWANDNFGHDMGDRFIQAVARILQGIFGKQRFCGRWGGDEFVACLTGDSIRYAEAMLRDFDREIRDLNESGKLPFRISVAYGLVRSTEQEVLSMDEALKEADKRMYTAKIRMYDANEAPGGIR